MDGQSSYRVTSPMTPSSNGMPAPSLFNRDMFQFRSLPRRSRLLSLPGSPVVPDMNLDCECAYNNNGKMKLTTGVLRSNSVTVVRPDASLNEVVERFEQVLRDQRSRLKRLPEANPSLGSRVNAGDFETPRVNTKASDFETLRVNSKTSEFGTQRVDSKASDFETCRMKHSSPLYLHNKSPSFGLNSFPRNCRVVESDHEDNRYKAFALMRQNTLPVNSRFQQENQVMAPNNVSDKLKESSLIVNARFQSEQVMAPNDVSDKLKESNLIVKRNGSWAGSRRSDVTNLSPEISPTNGTDDVFGSFVGSTSSAATTRSTSADSAVVGSKELTYESIEGVTIDPIREDSRSSVTSVRSIGIPEDSHSSITSVRSIGISTNFAPSFNRKTPPRVILQKESMTRSTSTQKICTNDFMCQAVPDRHSRGTNCLVPVAITSPLSRSIGVSVRPDPGYNESTQTHTVVSYDAGVQVCGKCSTCGVKQTETIATGESNVQTADIAVGPDDDMFERIRKERQRQRELDSIFVAKPAFVSDTRSPEDTPSAVPSSPTGMSRIPRLQQSCGGSPDSQIVIEETCNEILVYRRPNDSMVESPPACKIEEEAQAEEEEEEAQAEEEEGMSESSDDEDSVVREVLMRPPTKRTEPSKEMKEALKLVNDQLRKSPQLDAVQDTKLANAREIIEGEWFKVSSSKSSDPFVIEDFLDYFETLSSHLLNHIVNMTDCNGNTAMHYAISYSNFDAASVLLDSKVCDVNKLNKAGYSPLMLVSLSKIMNETQKAVVKRLFQLGDVNLRAKQNGQTALMLAASHGQGITVKLLLECGAAVNLQDSDGSTALMCASEHNHVHVVKLLLAHPETDPNLSDSEGSTALSIAMAAGHKDIGLVIYAATNILSRGSNAYSSLRRPSQAIATSLRRTGSFNSTPSNVSNGSNGSNGLPKPNLNTPPPASVSKSSRCNGSKPGAIIK